MSTTKLSIVMPAYNEEERIGPSLESILAFLSAQSYRSEVIVVNDGSTDGTVAVVTSKKTGFEKAGIPLRILTNDPNRGKGYSVKRGVTEATGDIVLFTDSDLSSPITEAPKLIGPIESQGVDLAFGSRALNRKLIAVRQPLIRDIGGRIFNLLLKTITWLPFKDTQCGFKALRRDKVLLAAEQQRIEGFGFDPELLYIAKKHGLKLLEVPVAWSHVEGSRLNYARESAKMFVDLLIVRLNDLMGRYPHPGAASRRTSGKRISVNDRRAEKEDQRADGTNLNASIAAGAGGRAPKKD